MAKEDERARINELLEERGKCVSEMREMLDFAESENRDLGSEEKEKYGKLEATRSSGVSRT